MDLTRHPSPVAWPATHYVYIEKIGPFQETAMQAWQELHSILAELATISKITGHMSLYKPNPERMIYRAGVMLTGKPERLPKGLEYTLFLGGKYEVFTLKGSYSQLPEACGEVFKIIVQTELPLRADFFIENYVNDPKATPEAQLITEILIPIL